MGPCEQLSSSRPQRHTQAAHGQPYDAPARNRTAAGTAALQQQQQQLTTALKIGNELSEVSGPFEQWTLHRWDNGTSQFHDKVYAAYVLLLLINVHDYVRRKQFLTIVKAELQQKTRGHVSIGTHVE